MPCSGFRPPNIEAVRGSLLEAALEGGGGRGLTIWQSWGDDGEVRVIGALPLPGVVSRSEVWCRIGVLTLSGVRDLSEFRGTGDWPLPDRTDPVLFLLTWGERVCSGARPELAGRERPPCWLGPAKGGEFCTRATSPTTS